MSQQNWRWLPLTTAEAVIEAIKAGRHVEMMPRGNRKGWLSINPKAGAEQFTAWIDDGDEFRALIAPAQPAADELRGGAAEPVGAVSAAAQKIAERVPLPEPHESAVVCLTPEGYAHGNMLDVQLQAPQGTGMRRGDVLYTAAQMEALRLAVAEEALSGAEAVGTVTRINFTNREATIKYTGYPAFPPFDVGHSVFTAPPAGSVELTDAMVWRAARALCEKPPTLIKFDQETETNRAFWRELARTALTAALQEPEA